MKKILIFFVLLFTIAVQSQEAPHASNRIVAELKIDPNKSVNNLNELEQLNFLFNDYLIDHIKPLDIGRTKTLNGRPIVIIFKNDININAVIQKLLATNLFSYVEPDFIFTGSGVKMEGKTNEAVALFPFNTTPNDTYFFRQWGLHNNGTFTLSPSTADADVDMIEAWDITTGSADIKMAVIDSGIKMNHPEFFGRILVNTQDSSDGFDTDNNGFIDDFRGWDFVNNDNNPTDDHGHGTNVSGIAMATGNNGFGYAGVDWNCKLLPIKVLDANNAGLGSNIIASFYYALDRNVDLISISIGGTGFSTAYQNVVNLAYTQNIPIIACMMNFNNSTPYYPAAFPSVIAVGSTNPNDYRTVPFFWSPTSGSNFGPHIDVVAPGNYSYGLSHISDTSYDTYWGGTSQATPLVAGVVSLMLALEPTLLVDEIRNIIRNTAQDQIGNPSEDIPGFDNYYGAGRVNAKQALVATQMLAIKSSQFDNDLSIYPVPTKDFLYLKSSQSAKISVYGIIDVTGRKITNFNQIDNKINVSELKSGIYFLQIVIDGINFTRKFIKS